MRYFLSKNCVLRWLETPSVYDIKRDELYELDEPAFNFLQICSSPDGCEDLADRAFVDYCINEGIIVDEKVETKRPILKKSPEPSLRYLELQITRNCNLRCKHCYIGPSENIELSIKQTKRVLDEFETMQGLRLLITGGEPLLYSSFEELNEILPEYALRKILFTNGILLDEKLIERLNVDELQVSIDGLEESHDVLRGKGTYKRAMKSIRLAINTGLEVSISTMVHTKNLYNFDEMEKLFKRSGIKDWTVDVPCVEGNLRDNPLFQISPDVAGKYLRYGFGDGLYDGDSGFACGLHLMSVTADGRAAKCAFYSNAAAGHIDEGLENCWKRIKPIRLEELKCDCSEVDACRGGCRYRAELLGGPLGKDLYRCFAYDIIKLP